MCDHSRSVGSRKVDVHQHFVSNRTVRTRFPVNGSSKEENRLDRLVVNHSERKRRSTPTDHSRHSRIRRLGRQLQLVSIALKIGLGELRFYAIPVLSRFSWQPIIDYIDSKYEEYLNGESRVVRKAHIVDNRIHCCLYFLAPTGHRFVFVLVVV